MKFTVDTEVEEISLVASSIITGVWQQVAEADRREDPVTAEALKRYIHTYLDTAAGAVAGNTSGSYRVVWGREQVIVMLPKPKAVAA